jgi:pimeloyl-ACP methyl ester carboxylesterase
VEDILSAVSYLETRDDIDRGRLGAFGSGGTGGGNVVQAAGSDQRLRAIVSQVPIADGRDWLRRMRSESEWVEFLERLDRDRRERALTGRSTIVNPREEIMVPTSERRTTKVKADVDRRVPTEVELSSADAIFAYRPIDVAGRIAPRAAMFICVEHDATTPEDHAISLFERSGAPKKLVVQTGTTHYAAYEQYGDVVTPMIVDWFTRYLPGGEVRAPDRTESSVVQVHPRTTSLG